MMGIVIPDTLIGNFLCRKVPVPPHININNGLCGQLPQFTKRQSLPHFLYYVHRFIVFHYESYRHLFGSGFICFDPPSRVFQPHSTIAPSSMARMRIFDPLEIFSKAPSLCHLGFFSFSGAESDHNSNTSDKNFYQQNQLL